MGGNGSARNCELRLLVCDSFGHLQRNLWQFSWIDNSINERNMMEITRPVLFLVLHLYEQHEKQNRRC